MINLENCLVFVYGIRFDILPWLVGKEEQYEKNEYEENDFKCIGFDACS